MPTIEKVNKLLKTNRGPQEIQDWLFSLTPLGVAFTFFIIFMSTIEVPNKDVIYAVGIAAGFIGLETYWIFRGWKKNHFSTIIFGLAGIAFTLAMVWLYMTFAREALPVS